MTVAVFLDSCKVETAFSGTRGKCSFSHYQYTVYREKWTEANPLGTGILFWKEKALL